MITTDLVLLGGGHSHALVLKMWGMNPLPGVRLTLISDRSVAPYSGMLPGHVAGFYSFEECHIDLRHLAEFAGAQFYLDRAVGLDLAQNQVLCDRRPPVTYDWLSIDIGSTPQRQTVPGAEHTIAAKPVHHFLHAWEKLLEEIHARPDYPWRIAIVGGGAGGVELVLALQARIQRLAREAKRPLTVQFHLLQGGMQLMTGHGTTVHDTFARCLNDRNIKVHLQTSVIAVETANPGYILKTTSGLELACDGVFWATQAAPAPWLAASGLATDDRGFILVTDTLQSCSHPQIFAAGDVATMENHPRPKAGVFAVRQGKPLYENLKRVVQGQAPRLFVPQKALLALIGDGNGRAAASRGGWGLPLSKPLWQWKDQIDRRFMAKFENLSPQRSMDRSRSKSSPPLMYCAGCGSKASPGVLEATLQRIRQEKRLVQVDQPPDIVVGLAGSDDAAVIQGQDRLLVQTVDFFPTPFRDPYLTGQVMTEHCLNDLYALGADPHSALAIVTVPHGQPPQQEETLYQLLTGVVEGLQAAGATLLGGHTTAGQDLAVGLSCNGWVNPGDLWRKQHLQAGQVLILTKALGTGTLFVAEQNGKAKATWLDTAIESMRLSHRTAVQILRQYGATACTDVTGFGLWGHAQALLGSTDLHLHLHLDLAALPLLPGALDSLAAGYFSSLYPQNLSHYSAHYSAHGDRVTHFTPASPENHPHWPALFDPQTSGGLLAAVPPEQAAPCLQALQDAGYGHSTIVGWLGSGDSIDNDMIPIEPCKI